MMFIASIITCIVFCIENILIAYKNSMEEIYKINLGMNFVTIAFYIETGQSLIFLQLLLPICIYISKL